MTKSWQTVLCWGFVCCVAKANKDLDIEFWYNCQFISITAAEVYFNSIVERWTSESHGRDFFSASFVCLNSFFTVMETVVCGSNIMLNIFLLHVSCRFVHVPSLFPHCLLMWIKRGTCISLLSSQSLFYKWCVDEFVLVCESYWLFLCIFTLNDFPLSNLWLPFRSSYAPF